VPNRATDTKAYAETDGLLGDTMQAPPSSAGIDVVAATTVSAWESIKGRGRFDGSMHN
jgi:hypothetical protein